MRLATLQTEHLEWVTKNFPHQMPHQPLLGLAEEVGELAHAHLKSEQGIRGYDGLTSDEYRDEAIDAIGDIVIYLASYCNSVGIDLADAVDLTCDKVSKRNWQQDSLTGGEGWPLRKDAP